MHLYSTPFLIYSGSVWLLPPPLYGTGSRGLAVRPTDVCGKTCNYPLQSLNLPCTQSQQYYFNSLEVENVPKSVCRIFRQLLQLPALQSHSLPPCPWFRCGRESRTTQQPAIWGGWSACFTILNSEKFRRKLSWAVDKPIYQISFVIVQKMEMFPQLFSIVCATWNDENIETKIFSTLFQRSFSRVKSNIQLITKY